MIRSSMWSFTQLMLVPPSERSNHQWHSCTLSLVCYVCLPLHILCKVFLSFPNRSIACPPNLQVVESEKHRTGRCQGLSILCHFIQGIWAAANFDMRRDSISLETEGQQSPLPVFQNSQLAHLYFKCLSCLWHGVWKSLSCVQFFATSWTIQSMELSRPEY